mmetsp:Transcript_51519/g.104849  ORF Transcript_51519/g.104849 Transcript_51519/m.104849 type:complete len:175 (+) Transcript_51519:109-633(+)|eukprot:CAMPEP_0181320054 /NCGR_PEP_ID=MMETSP1101-20121128/17910_1 /TAXON_ID=46948 /ORGANISM="Rhodomonas abbreviata, Strain Caron Lab Isolate" /LENGTH=174 /DNA_ID=CAMNT_0023427715 /DNA_START=109 /DNA_END=633 /DNA_ORIENTATION=-
MPEDSDKDIERTKAFPQFKGREAFRSWKGEVHEKCMNYGLEIMIFTRAGRIIHEKIQMIIDLKIHGAVPGNPVTIKTHPNDYTDNIWDAEMKKGKLHVKMKSEKLQCLRTKLTNQYHNKERMDCKTDEELAELHMATLSSYYQNKNRLPHLFEDSLSKLPVPKLDGHINANASV